MIIKKRIYKEEEEEEDEERENDYNNISIINLIQFNTKNLGKVSQALNELNANIGKNYWLNKNSENKIKIFYYELHCY